MVEKALKNVRFDTVSHVMHKDVVYIDGNKTVADAIKLYCARLFNNAGVRRAPVFDGKEIIGIVSNTDIFNAIKV